MNPRAKKAFDNILKYIEEEDYDRCTSSASDFLRVCTDPHAQRYQPYAEFFKLFALGYHTWQGSYHYTPIRSCFIMASYRLDKIKGDPDHTVVVKLLQTLCEMLKEYTWCENSAINNDPFALERHSQAAIKFEQAGLACLADFASEEPNLKRIAKWLRTYLQNNLYLHTGLNACALIYSSIMRDRACSETLFRNEMRRAKEALDKLIKLSPELSSELNAHIRHLQLHYERLTPPEFPTFLRVRSGKLVLSLSAACDRAGVRNILNSDSMASQTFKEETRIQLEQLGLEVRDNSFRPTQLMDIFETSFGESFLKSLTFDVGPSPVNGPSPVELTFLHDPIATVRSIDDPVAHSRRNRSFDFDIRVTLSALGACTVAFEMAIDDDHFPLGLSVEEIRALESCICPHAGQVRIKVKRNKASKASPATFFDRVNMVELDMAIQKLADEENQLSETTLANVKTLKQSLEEYLNCALSESPSAREERDRELCKDVNAVVELVADTTHASDLLDICNSHDRLAGVAVELLEAVELAFRKAIAPEKRSEPECLSGDELWLLRPNLGWYAYLFAKQIDQVTTALEPVKEAVAFSDIQGHADTHGFVIGQREARASFDDWRFMTRRVSRRNNLAHVRSHAADAFYTSEFQTFFYFPDVQQYLAAQYEETVKLNLILNIGLRFYNTMAEKLTYEIRDNDGSSASRQDKLRDLKCDLEPLRGFERVRNLALRMVPGVRRIPDWVRRLKRDSKRMRDLEGHLKRVRRLRFEANELRNLVLRAGISRYQDHGQLMKRIIDQMNVEAAAVITDRHLMQLEDVSREIIERLKASRLKWLSYAGLVFTSMAAASLAKGFVEAWTVPRGGWTVFFMAAAVVVTIAIGVIGLILGKAPFGK